MFQLCGINDFDSAVVEVEPPAVHSADAGSQAVVDWRQVAGQVGSDFGATGSESLVHRRLAVHTLA